MDEGSSKENRRRRLKTTDTDFIPPDGGWGWLIVVACGLGNLSVYPILQEFGLFFREKFHQIGITNTETTTIINLNSAFVALVGLFIGPLFRRFTYRKVAISGATMVCVSIFALIFSNTFVSYLFLFSVLYGIGIGLTTAANYIALNTYFKQRRRIATGLSWSTTACGGIIWPYVVTAMMTTYGMSGTLLIFAGFTGNALVCALLLHPVHWHTKFKDIVQPLIERKKSLINSYCIENEKQTITHESVDSKDTLENSNNESYSRLESNLALASKEIMKPSLITGQGSKSKKYCDKMDTSNDKQSAYKAENKATSIDDDSVTVHLLGSNSNEASTDNANNQKIKVKKKGILSQICSLFDFDLLKDPVFVNLMLGLNIANFCEVNFAILIPFVLKEFNFEKYQIATFMSVMGATDILFRLIFPFIADRIGWSNRTFYLCGILTTAAGRIILVHTRVYSVGLLVAVIIGFGKALYTVFMVLLVPTYVSLDKLPGATGMQLASNGILCLLVGPLVGLLRDVFKNFVITLHILNVLTYITIISWTVEGFISRRRSNKSSL